MFSAVTDVVRAVDRSGGLLTTTLADLKEATQQQRLTSGIRRQIAEQLEEHHLGYFPMCLLDSEIQEKVKPQDEIRVYRRDSQLGRLVDAVLKPSQVGDELLLGSRRNNNSGDKLHQIRRILAA